MKNLKSPLLLFVTAIVWGCAFVAQSVGMDHLGPLTFNGIRYLLGALSLLPFTIISVKKDSNINIKTSLTAGILCGLALSGGTFFQQLGIALIPVGRVGFITSLYIVIVPFLEIFKGKRLKARIWISIVIAVLGLYLLCVKGDLALEKGDVYAIIGAFIFSLHIIVIDRYANINGVLLSFLQFLFSGIIFSIAMVIFEEFTLNEIMISWKSILYAGIISCGIGYTFQVLGQKGVKPAVASLILSLESVTSVIAGFIILGQKLSLREIIGCAIMFLAVILAQLPELNRKD